MATDPNGFDTLMTKNVPHILEKIFLSLDYESFKACGKVNNKWKGLLTSESFKTRAELEFKDEIEKEHRARINKSLDELKDLLVLEGCPIGIFGEGQELIVKHLIKSEGYAIDKVGKAGVLELAVQHLLKRKLKQNKILQRKLCIFIAVIVLWCISMYWSFV